MGRPISVIIFVDTSHTGKKLTYCPDTGILIYANNTPVDWFSKHQNTVETPTFGTELIVARIAMGKG